MVDNQIPKGFHHHPNGGGLVEDTALVAKTAYVGPNARVCGNAQIYGSAWIKFNLTKDFLDKTAGVAATTNTHPDPNGFYLFFKRVNKISEVQTIFKSVHDPLFIFTLGVPITTETDSDSLLACGKGLHVSMPDYQFSGDTLLQVAVHQDSIISWMKGKIRCSSLVPLRIID